MEVRRAERLGSRMVRVTLAGPELEGFTVDEPAASVRLLIPSRANTGLEMPAWNGNEFLLADGTRPAIRTFTPRRVDPDALELDLDMVVHGHGAAMSSWADAASPGMQAAVSGPGRGYLLPADARRFLLAGDETAIPAIDQLLAAIPADVPVDAHIEVAAPEGRLPMTREVTWHDLDAGAGAAPGDAMVAAVRAAEIDDDTHVWVAGEAAAVQKIRRHLFEERGVTRDRATVRGYWSATRGTPTEL